MVKFIRFKKQLFLILMLIALIVNVKGQDLSAYGKVNIVTPTSLSIMKFDDIPLSLHTGVPQISIQLKC